MKLYDKHNMEEIDIKVDSKNRKLTPKDYLYKDGLRQVIFTKKNAYMIGTKKSSYRFVRR